MKRSIFNQNISTYSIKESGVCVRTTDIVWSFFYYYYFFLNPNQTYIVCFNAFYSNVEYLKTILLSKLWTIQNMKQLFHSRKLIIYVAK